ncbi:Type 1 glutamine amidotransferase-like domain-containing protein [Alkalihalobacillus sp. R86527]|uniref:Type 1 glutamine amidotransferase-like domain-containing protein n=1 Tax=Alkalihalobacillus sp. R86527 TaxID=3093863 RepID=UPI00366DBACB
MGELILSGGGGATQTLEMNRYFVSRLQEVTSVLYIPLAGDEDYRTYECCYEYTCSLFPDTQVTMWTDLSEKTYEDMTSFSGVYMSGGSVTKLLSELVKTGFDLLLKKFFADGGIIYGQSAGAIVLGETVKHYEKSEPKIGSLKNLDGLKLLGAYTVWCHYTAKDEGVVKRYSNEYELPILTIPDGTAVVVNQKSMLQIGEIPPHVIFKDEKKSIL